MKHTKWKIWSIEHNAWWASDYKGYVEHRDSAGIYPFEQAVEIVRGTNYNLETPIIAQRNKVYNKKLHTPNEAMILV